MSDLPTTDREVLELLRRQPSQTVHELSVGLGVTATAVRQRLVRLMASGYVTRETRRVGRGRPSHRYSLSNKGHQLAGANFADLAAALWSELRAIPDPAIRRGMLERISRRLAGMYSSKIDGASLEARMEQLAALMAEREIPFEVEKVGPLPVLHALACPYPELAEQDRALCAMERQMMSQVLGQPMRLTRCRLDGETCCTFQAVAVSEPVAEDAGQLTTN
ncbi:MAG: transcriptional regulator [Pirellulaceae bacterium]|nr:MAG: transcriptional regulator [Pirellulaceae bacterium]